MLLIITLIALLTCLAVPLAQKKPNSIWAHLAIALFFIYEGLFIAFHPLIGLICLICGSFILYTFYKGEVDTNFFNTRFIILPVIMIFGFGFAFQIIETFAGRLF